MNNVTPLHLWHHYFSLILFFLRFRRNGPASLGPRLDIDVHINRNRHNPSESVECPCTDWVYNHETHFLDRASTDTHSVGTAQC